MATRIAYLGVIIIWSTTPLAIQWSSEGAGFLFAVTSRMILGLGAAGVLLLLLRQSLPLHARAFKTYLAGGLGIYFAMSSVYWSSQYIPSGWISVMFGLSPIITGIMAMLILGEQALTPRRLLGMLLGLAGLALIFGKGYSSDHGLFYGIAGVFFGTVVHSLSAVLIKRIKAGISGMASTTGALAVAVPLFCLTWLIQGDELPVAVPARSFYAIIYLGALASSVGFGMYYYILSRLDVGRVSLITLITPVCALLLGNYLNDEPVSITILGGTGLILAGLLLYEFGDRLTGLRDSERI